MLWEGVEEGVINRGDGVRDLQTNSKFGRKNTKELFLVRDRIQTQTPNHFAMEALVVRYIKGYLNK